MPRKKFNAKLQIGEAGADAIERCTLSVGAQEFWMMQGRSLTPTFMTANLLATALLLIGCYSGIGPSADDAATEPSATTEATTENSSDETGAAESRVVRVDDFVGDYTLQFEIPMSWENSQWGDVVSAANFPPPHMGMAGSLPEGYVIEILPHLLPIPEQTLEAADVEGWMRGSLNNSDLTTTAFVNPDTGISFIASSTTEMPLSDNDLQIFLGILETVQLVQG